MKVINEGTDANLFEIMTNERARKGQKAGVEGQDVELINLYEDIF